MQNPQSKERSKQDGRRLRSITSQNIIVDGHKVHFGQREHPTNLAQMIPLTDDENVPGNFYVQEHDANHSPLILAERN